MRPICDRPCAAKPFISYRCKDIYGKWIMIGALNNEDAMREAWRSSAYAKREDLQVWNGTEYVTA